MALGQLIVRTGILVARQCDRHVHRVNPNYPEHMLENIVSTSRVCKARLLHYFPMVDSIVSEDDAWCGWHNDHGSLTGLTVSMYLDKDGNEIACPDPRAGLYIASRKGKIVQVKVPSDHLAFQIGETAQIHTGGVLQATPHYVRGAETQESRGVSRETMAVFMEPHWDHHMRSPDNQSIERVLSGSTQEFLPVGVPLLKSRWTPEHDFGKFSEITYKSYY